MSDETFDFHHGIRGVLPNRRERAELPDKAPLPPCGRHRRAPMTPTPRDPDADLLALLEPPVSDPFSLAPMHYQALLGESRSLFAALAKNDGDGIFARAAELLEEAVFLLGIVAQHKR